MSKASKRSPADELILRSWLSVVQAYNLCDAVMTQRMGAIGMRAPEHEILANLKRDPGITQQRLAQRCFTAKSHMSALLGTLEERGWVRREVDPGDARAKRLYLEPAGEAAAARTAAVQAEIVATMAGALTAEQMAQVMDAMQRLSERLKTMLG